MVKRIKESEIITKDLRIVTSVVQALRQLKFIDIEDGKENRNYKISFRNDEMVIKAYPMNPLRELLLTILIPFYYTLDYGRITVKEMCNKYQLYYG